MQNRQILKILPVNIGKVVYPELTNIMTYGHDVFRKVVCTCLSVFIKNTVVSKLL